MKIDILAFVKRHPGCRSSDIVMGLNLIPSDVQRAMIELRFDNLLIGRESGRALRYYVAKAQTLTWEKALMRPVHWKAPRAKAEWEAVSCPVIAD